MAIRKRGFVPVQVQVIDRPAATVLVNPGEPAFGDGDLADAVAIRFGQPADHAGARQSSCPPGPAAAISRSWTLPKPGRRFVPCGATVRSPPGNRQKQFQRDRGPQHGWFVWNVVINCNGTPCLEAAGISDVQTRKFALVATESPSQRQPPKHVAMSGQKIRTVERKSA